MTLSRPIGCWIGAGVLLAGALLAVGCDGNAVGPAGERVVVFDIGPLFRSAEGEACATVVDSLIVVVTEADGTEQVARRALTPDETEVRIPVAVTVGRVEFEAEVRSNNGRRLYAGTAAADVEADGFRVEVPLAAVDAVLKACPDLVPLTLDDGAYRGAFRLANLGSRPAEWAASFESPVCDGAPCFRLGPDAGTLAAGDSLRIAATALATTLNDALDVRITSPVGTLDLRLVAELLMPDAQPDTVTVLEGDTVEIDVLANDTDPGGDPLTLVEVGPATFGTVVQDGDLAFYTADYTARWGATSEDGFPYVVDAGGRRAEGSVAVRVGPCITFEAAAATGSAGVGIYSENGVALTTRVIAFDDGSTAFDTAYVAPVFGQNEGSLGLYLENAAIEFDWSEQPVRYVRFEFRNEARVVNAAFNRGERLIAPDVEMLALPPGITPRIEPGTLGGFTRLVLEAEPEAAISYLLLGGGDEFRDDDRLTLDNVCFGLAPPDED